MALFIIYILGKSKHLYLVRSASNILDKTSKSRPSCSLIPFLFGIKKCTSIFFHLGLSAEFILVWKINGNIFCSSWNKCRIYSVQNLEKWIFIFFVTLNSIFSNPCEINQWNIYNILPVFEPNGISIHLNTVLYIMFNSFLYTCVIALSILNMFTLQWSSELLIFNMFTVYITVIFGASNSIQHTKMHINFESIFFSLKFPNVTSH